MFNFLRSLRSRLYNGIESINNRLNIFIGRHPIIKGTIEFISDHKGFIAMGLVGIMFGFAIPIPVAGPFIGFFAFAVIGDILLDEARLIRTLLSFIFPSLAPSTAYCAVPGKSSTSGMLSELSDEAGSKPENVVQERLKETSDEEKEFVVADTAGQEAISEEDPEDIASQEAVSEEEPEETASHSLKR